MITAAFKQFRNPQNIRYVTSYYWSGFGPGESRNVTINTSHPQGGARNVILAYFTDNATGVTFTMNGETFASGGFLNVGDEDFYSAVGVRLSKNKTSADSSTLNIQIQDTYYYVEKIYCAVFVLTGELNQDNIYNGRNDITYMQNFWHPNTTLDIPAEGCAINIIVSAVSGDTVDFAACDFTESGQVFDNSYGICKVGLVQTVPSAITVDCFPSIQNSNVWHGIATAFGR